MYTQCMYSFIEADPLLTQLSIFVKVLEKICQDHTY